jgi:hypothetical protein
VSIAEDNMGIFKIISFVSLDRMSTSRGNTWEKPGTNSTSSNVKPSPKNLSGLGDLALEALFIVAMCKDRATDKCVPNDFFTGSFSDT